MTDISSEIADLEVSLNSILPEPDENDIYDDGSHECYANLFETAYDRADTVARDAINLLKSIQGEEEYNPHRP